jgi:signal transduction histidine kinase
MTELQSNTMLNRYMKLIDISRDLSSTLDHDVLLNRIVNAAAELSDANAASILLYDKSKKQLFFQASTNLDSLLMRGLIVPVEGSIAGTIVKTRKPIISQAQQDPRHFNGLEEKTKLRVTTLLGVPLITKGEVIGVLEAINKREGDFTQDDMDVLSALGSQAAVAIDNAHLFQQSDLISEMVHEIRTPLASLSTASHLLTRPNLSENQRTTISEAIIQETNRLSEMTTSFLDLARLESGRSQFKIEEVDLNNLIDEVVTVMSSRMDEKGIGFSSNSPPELPMVQADRSKIKQVILNLLSNAIKYNIPNGSIHINCHSGYDSVAISIQDTGLGIPAEYINNLFEKFFRVPDTMNIAHGTGLGLSICKKIIETHGGTIEVESQTGVGTTFTIRLPILPGITQGL